MENLANAGTVAPVIPAAGVPPVESQSTTESEKLVPQSTVDKIVGGVKRDSYERGKQEALESLKSSNVSSGTLSADAVKEVVKSVLSEEKISSQKAHEENAAKELQLKNEAAEKDILSQLAPKIHAAQQAYPDFIQQMNESGISDKKEIAYFANLAQDAGSVLYELSKSPAKLATLSVLIDKNPKGAQKYVLELEQQIKGTAATQKVAPKPLGQLKPSVAPDNGKMTLQDLKRKYRV